MTYKVQFNEKLSLRNLWHDFLVLIKVRSYKHNVDKLQPFTREALKSLYKTHFTVLNFARTSRKFFVCHHHSNSHNLVLYSKNLKKSISIDFNKDEFGYISIRPYKRNHLGGYIEVNFRIHTKYPRSAKELLYFINKHNLL